MSKTQPVQYYWDNVLGGKEEVQVKPRTEQRQCEHHWCPRHNPNKTRHGDSWRSVCKLCGACCR